MFAGGIMPHSELLELCSYGCRVSPKNNANGWVVPFRSFIIDLEAAGILVTNGDGVIGAFGGVGER